MPQHLQVVRACSHFSDGQVEGAELKSLEILYRPGKSLKSGNFRWDIGTGGSTTMLAFTLIPLALFSRRQCRFSIVGGLFQDNAPSAFHMQKVLIPILQRMGANVQVEILRPGYLPRGQGELKLEVKPADDFLRPLSMIEQGEVKEISGISMASHLEKEKVSERMANRCQELLERRGYPLRIEVRQDKKALQKGAALFLRAETDTGCLLGADRVGKPGRRSEAIADFAVKSLLEDLQTKATADRYLADQLILFAGLAQGTTEYLIPRVTEHVESNLWLVKEILAATFELQGRHLRVEGIGFRNPGAQE
jgi:RNA 3'-terminal phosphate cyclase (ATP)